MFEILKYVLSSFWTFAGTAILIYITGMSVSMIISAATGKSGSYSLIDFSGKNTKNSTNSVENEEDKRDI